MGDSGWKDFDLAKGVERAESWASAYLEFLWVPQLSSDIDRLRVGSSANESSHDEHEFSEIAEDLSLLVFFGSGGPSGASSIEG